MDKKILKTGKDEFKRLARQYKGFINVIIDDWRGYRFIFDTAEVRNCRNDCPNCRLFQLLKDEKPGWFSSGLYQASLEDKLMFGPQNQLNCKTLEQYRRCYLNFLGSLSKREEINAELALVRGLELIYCRNGGRKEKGRRFKRSIYNKFFKKQV